MVSLFRAVCSWCPPGGPFVFRTWLRSHSLFRLMVRSSKRQQEACRMQCRHIPSCCLSLQARLLGGDVITPEMSQMDPSVCSWSYWPECTLDWDALLLVSSWLLVVLHAPVDDVLFMAWLCAFKNTCTVDSTWGRFQMLHLEKWFNINRQITSNFTSDYPETRYNVNL